MPSQYNIKDIKTLEMYNGVALTANLYYGKTFVASIEDRGDGGEVTARWTEDENLHRHMIQQWWKQNCEGHWTARFLNDGDCTEMALALLLEYAELNKDAKSSIVFQSGEDTYKVRKSNLSDQSAMMKISKDYPEAKCWNADTQKWIFIGSFFAENVSA